MKRGWQSDDRTMYVLAAAFLQYGVEGLRRDGLLASGRYEDIISDAESVVSCLAEQLRSEGMSVDGQSRRVEDQPLSTELVDTDEVATVLGISRRHAARLVSSGTVPGRRFGARWFVVRADLDRYVERQEAS